MSEALLSERTPDWFVNVLKKLNPGNATRSSDQPETKDKT